MSKEIKKFINNTLYKSPMMTDLYDQVVAINLCHEKPKESEQFEDPEDYYHGIAECDALNTDTKVVEQTYPKTHRFSQMLDIMKSVDTNQLKAKQRMFKIANLLADKNGTVYKYLADKIKDAACQIEDAPRSVFNSSKAIKESKLDIVEKNTSNSIQIGLKIE